MILYLLVTDEMKATMPETINIIENYGNTRVVFPDENNNIQHEMNGDNIVIEASNEDLIK